MYTNRHCRAAVMAIALVATAANADIVVNVDKLDASDGLPMPSPNLVVVDVSVDVTSFDAWSSTGIFGYADNGARLAYAYDPNGVVPTAPGVNNRFVTFFSRPRERDANARFGANGAVVLSSALYGLLPVFLPTEVNAVVYGSVHEFGRDGYVLRVALDLSEVSDPRFRLDSDNIVVSTTQLSGAVALFETFSPTGFDHGLLVTNFYSTELFSGFGIYGIPEPASGILLVVGAVWLLRRRSA